MPLPGDNNVKVALVTTLVPPFSYRSPWWWGLDRFSVTSLHVELIGPSGEHQFQRRQFEHGTASLLNVFSEGEEDWTERERVEFSVKSYVFLSKMARSVPFDRIVVADAAGIEPLLVSILAPLGPVWVKPPRTYPSSTGKLGRDLLELARRVFHPREFVQTPDLLDEWPPRKQPWTRVFEALFTSTE